MTEPRRDWHAWHRGYDDPGSDLSRRLEEVRRQVALRLGTGGVRRVLSLCAGDGRDLLPVLAAVAPHTPALLVELDPGLARSAHASAAALGLDGVEVRIADAGSTDACHGWGPSDLLLACGVFGNVVDADMERTVASLPGLLAPGGHVVWTRGAAVPDDPTERPGDPAEHVRRAFARAGFVEVALVRSREGHFRVGVHRLVVPPADRVPGHRMFSFVGR